jgi:hypothetical protein
VTTTGVIVDSPRRIDGHAYKQCRESKAQADLRQRKAVMVLARIRQHTEPLNVIVENGINYSDGARHFAKVTVTGLNPVLPSRKTWSPR